VLFGTMTLHSGDASAEGETEGASTRDFDSVAEGIGGINLSEGVCGVGGLVEGKEGKEGKDGKVEKKPVDKVSEEEMKRLEEAAEESGGVYDEVEIEDLEWNDGDSTFYYPCPCGDKFQVRD